MNFSETVSFNRRTVDELRKLVYPGEGTHLEFKRRAAYPEKVIREMIAFANSKGGTLLIGVDDDGTIPGVKYPEEEIIVIAKALQKHCRPALPYEESVIAISEKRFVVRYNVPVSERRPHFLVEDTNHKACFVRVNDMTVKASREVTEIVRRTKKNKDIRFTFGTAEKQLMEYLEQKDTITLQQFRVLAGLNRFLAAKKLILLVLANVIRITPTEKGDLYSRI